MFVVGPPAYGVEGALVLFIPGIVPFGRAAGGVGFEDESRDVETEIWGGDRAEWEREVPRMDMGGGGVEPNRATIRLISCSSTN